MPKDKKKSYSIYFHLVGGAAGDMLLSSLINLGCPFSYLKRELKKINIPFKINLKDIIGENNHIPKKELIFTGPSFSTYQEIKKIIKASSFDRNIKERINQVYALISKAESKVHNTKHVHFHHLGQIDAILEIAGFFIALEYLKVENIFVSTIPLSYPAPATLELLKNKPVAIANLPYETVTPTAAALLAQAKFQESCVYQDYGIGWGKGSDKDYLVSYIYREEMDGLRQEGIIKLETNIDDMNPQGFELLMEELYKNGAKEVYIENVIMKKSRPGFVLNVLCQGQDYIKLRDALFKHTTTFGIRYQNYKRDILKSQFVERKTKLGKIKFRIAQDFYKKEIPEYDDCYKVAKKNNLSVLEVQKYIK